MKVLILGKGFTGSRLYSKLQLEKVDVRIFSKKELDYTNSNRLGRYIKKHQPDYIVNASGYTGAPNVDACEADKENCWHYNVTVPLRISDACNRNRQKVREPKLYTSKLIHISSGCIYTGYDKDYTETDPSNFGLFDDDSSWYSKTKHAAELLLEGRNAYIFRIRMPFTKDNTSRNFLNKILKYDNLISYPNSMTGIEDFCEFIFKFMKKDQYSYLAPDIFNVINPEAVDIEQITSIMKKYDVYNPNWKFVDIKSLELKANRSNCILSDNKIKKLGLQLPNCITSLDTAIKTLSRS